MMINSVNKRSVVFASILSFSLFIVPNEVRSQTDYSDPARWVNVPSANHSPVDVFYLYPTAWQPTSNDQLYSEIDDPTLIAGGSSVFDRQATAFAPLANLYAPYYRQANANITLGLPIEEQTAIMNGIPKEDVFAALDYYFENYNKDRPFILAGHSQGSNVMLFVLSEYMKEHPEIYDRMIAAYAIGYSVTDEFLADNPHLRFAQGADDIQKIVSWNTEAPGTTGSNPVLLPDAIVINPLNWKRDGTYAGVEMNLGSLLRNAAGEYVLMEDVADAQVDPNRGVVIANADVNQYGMGGVLGFPNGSFHANDIQFYYMNIRENALRRSAIALSMYQTELYADAAYTTSRSVRAFSDQLPRTLDTSSMSQTCAPCSPCHSKKNSLTLFATPFGLWTRQNSQGHFSGYDFNAYGIAVGGMKTTGKTNYGFALGYNDQTQKMKEFDGRIDADLFHAVVFAGRKFGSISLDASAGYSHGWNDSERNVIFPGYARFDNKSSFDQNAWTVRLSANKTKKLRQHVRLIAGIGLDYVGIRTGSIQEDCLGQSPFQNIFGFGTNTAMYLKSATYHSLELPISLTIDKTFTHSSSKIVPYVSAAWIPELLNERSSTTASFVANDVIGSFLAQSIKPWDSHGRVATGLKAEKKTTSLAIDYVFDFSHRYTEHHLSATLGWHF